MIVLPHEIGGYPYTYLQTLLIKDYKRTDSFRKAVMKVVKKGDVVMDLGTGTGILSLFAHQAGARKIYAIESKEFIEVAKKIAIDNKMSRKIKFINDDSYSVDLPEKVDVIVSECIGWFVLGGSMISAVISARDRFLKKSGAIIPQSISMYIAPMESARHNYLYSNLGKAYGVDLSLLNHMLKNNVYQTTVDKDCLISHANKLTTINLSSGYPNEMIDKTVDFVIAKDSQMNGLCGWFQVQLCNGISFNTSPYDKPTNWQQAFFPLEKIIHLRKGERIQLHLKLERNDDESYFCFKWNITTLNGNTIYIDNHSTLESYPHTIKKSLVIQKGNIENDGKKRIKKLRKVALRKAFKKYKNAIKDLKNRIKRQPKNYRLNLLLAIYYNKLGKPNLASDSLKNYLLEKDI